MTSQESIPDETNSDDDIPALEEQPFNDNIINNIGQAAAEPETNEERINTMIRYKNYPPHLQYLINTEYFRYFDEIMQKDIYDNILPLIGLYQYNKELYIKILVEKLYSNRDFDIENIYNNIGIYLTTQSENSDDIENDMNIVRKYLIMFDEHNRRVSIAFSMFFQSFLPVQEDVKLIVPQDKLEQLPIITYEETNKLNSSCACCCEEFKLETKVKKVLCGHLFCPECIDEWLSNHSYKCPVCREPAGEYIRDI